MKQILYILFLIWYITFNQSASKKESKDNVMSYFVLPDARQRVVRSGLKTSHLFLANPYRRRIQDVEKVSKNVATKSVKDDADSDKDHIRSEQTTEREIKFDMKFTIDPDFNEMYQQHSTPRTKDERYAEKVPLKFRDSAMDIVPTRSYMFRSGFHMDPVLNLMRRYGFRRNDDPPAPDDESSGSSTQELKDWKDRYKEYWMIKKFEALNDTVPRGDQVNILQARPWGSPCGDPAQHDMPWGNCMLAEECEVEFRIYRGDLFCGRTTFVCCGLQLTNYDLDQGFDVSFDEASLSTDSAELRHLTADPNGNKDRRKRKQQRKRQAERYRRKRRIKRNIRKILHEITRILNKLYKNSTRLRKRKTNVLKKYIKKLKAKYLKDRLSVLELHGEQLMRIDTNLMKHLLEIKAMNREFMKNATFRDIVVNGMMSKAGARMLVEAYPELEALINTRRTMNYDLSKPKDYLEYDIEYGFLYN